MPSGCRAESAKRKLPRVRSGSWCRLVAACCGRCPGDGFLFGQLIVWVIGTRDSHAGRISRKSARPARAKAIRMSSGSLKPRLQGRARPEDHRPFRQAG